MLNSFMDNTLLIFTGLLNPHLLLKSAPATQERRLKLHYWDFGMTQYKRRHTWRDSFALGWATYTRFISSVFSDDGSCCVSRLDSWHTASQTCRTSLGVMSEWRLCSLICALALCLLTSLFLFFLSVGGLFSPSPPGQLMLASSCLQTSRRRLEQGLNWCEDFCVSSLLKPIIKVSSPLCSVVCSDSLQLPDIVNMHHSDSLAGGLFIIIAQQGTQVTMILIVCYSETHFFKSINFRARCFWLQFSGYLFYIPPTTLFGYVTIQPISTQ